MKQKKYDFPVSNVIDSFVSNIEGLRQFVKHIKPVAERYDQWMNDQLYSVKKQIKDLLCNRKDEENEEGQLQKTPKINDEEFENLFKKIFDATQTYRKMPWLNAEKVEILYRSALVMLTSYFDYLLCDLIRGYYRIHPEALAKDSSINISDLISCADVEEAIGIVIDKKIDSILYAGLEGQKAFFENFLKIDLKNNLIKWDVINGAAQRRNVFVHNNGIVNRRYLRRTNLNEFENGNQIVKLGGKLVVSAEYFNKVTDEILLAGVILTQICWRKWMKAGKEDADNNLLSHIFSMRVKGQYEVLERLGLFAREIEFHSPKTLQELNMNYFLAVKEKGGKSKMMAELSKFDDSNLTPNEMLYLSALKDDIDGFYINLKKPGAVKYMTSTVFYADPFFKGLRDNTDFKTMIEEVLGVKKGS